MRTSDEMRLWPLTRRMLGWAFVMACWWGWFPFLFGGELGVYFWLPSHEADPNNPGGSSFGIIFILPFLIQAAIFGCLTLGGAVVGAFAGVLAPTTEPGNPLKAPFFRSVGQWAFCFWFYSMLGLSLVFFLGFNLYLNLPKASWLSVYLVNLPGVAIYLFGLVASFVFASWRAVSGALVKSRANPLAE